MKWLASIIGVVLSFGFIAAGGVMNWRYGLGIGRTESDQLLNAGVHALIDACKVMLPFFGWWALDRKRWIVAAMCAVATVACIAYSAIGIAGFVDMSRSVSSGELLAKKDDVAGWRAELSRSERRLGEVGRYDPASVTEQRMAQLHQDARWSVSKQCTDATARTTREFCAELKGLETERAKAIEAGKLEARIAELRGLINTRAGVAAIDAGDPRSGIVARLTGWELLKVQTWLSLLFVGIVEFMATFGMFLSLNHGALSRAAREGRGVASAPVSDAGAGDVPLVPAVASLRAMPRPVVARRSAADDVPLLEHQPVGQIIRFVAERTEPAKGGTELAALHAGYVAWCEGTGASAVDCDMFERELDRIRAMPEVGERVSKFGTRYIGIALAKEKAKGPRRRARA